MVAYVKSGQRKKEGDRLTAKRDEIKFIDLRVERGQVVVLGKEEGRTLHKKRKQTKGKNTSVGIDGTTMTQLPCKGDLVK